VRDEGSASAILGFEVDRSRSTSIVGRSRKPRSSAVRIAGRRFRGAWDVQQRPITFALSASFRQHLLSAPTVSRSSGALQLIPRRDVSHP
jgi:hypothetical protein